MNDEQEVVKEVGRFWGIFFYKWESDTRTEKGDGWKGYDK